MRRHGKCCYQLLRKRAALAVATNSRVSFAAEDQEQYIFLTKASLLLVIIKKNEGLYQQVHLRISLYGSSSAGQA